MAMLIAGALPTRNLSAEPASARQQPGAEITLFAPEQHDLYDGRWMVRAGGVHQVGGLGDAPGWDHIDNGGTTA